jgi:peptidyl-prolyl cis-trans isomerase B (cyclophilin B)
MIRKYFLSIAIACVLFIVGCASPDTPTASSSDGSSAETAPIETTDSAAAPAETAEESPTEAQTDSETAAQASTDEAYADLPRLEGDATVELQVNGSTIVIQVNGNTAPITAGNFVDLVQRDVYNGTVFHRVVRQPQPFVVQGGDPQSSDPNADPALFGTGSFNDPQTGQPRYIPLEIQPDGADSPLYGQTLSSARISADPELPHRRGAVAMARSAQPNSASAQFYFALADLDFLDGDYAVFGYVTEGMDVVDQIQQGDRIESATVSSGAENLVTP